ncbi:hypothetical protein BJY01DRAFT_204228 [Aspergillus pseudoustus]|uniref:Uncharacterized protein n=1 Tax=Aspergillus pseudoustus TaxID=1810923 RepID=A0ABR4KT74_9EURO
MRSKKERTAPSNEAWHWHQRRMRRSVKRREIRVDGGGNLEQLSLMWEGSRAGARLSHGWPERNLNFAPLPMASFQGAASASATTLQSYGVLNFRLFRLAS